MARILVVDDHPLFRDGFSHMARVLRPAWVLYFSDNAAHALTVVKEIAVDLVIVDASLPGADGFALLKAIAQVSTAIPQILISGREDAAIRIRAQAAGVRTFISKTSPPEQIASAIDAVLDGNSKFDPGGERDHLPALTPRQVEVLMLLAEGLGNKEIRHRLNIAERTVRAHLTELFQVLRAHSRTQALVRARELGLIA